MKRLFLAVLVLTLAGGAAFAQNKSCTEDRAVIQLTEYVKGDLNSAKEVIAKTTEWKPTHILQSMISLMDDYMKLRSICPAAAAPLAKEIQKPVSAGWLKEGGTIVISQYINQNSQNIYYTEAQKFDNFAATVIEDAKK